MIDYKVMLVEQIRKIRQKDSMKEGDNYVIKIDSDSAAQIRDRYRDPDIMRERGKEYYCGYEMKISPHWEVGELFQLTKEDSNVRP